MLVALPSILPENVDEECDYVKAWEQLSQSDKHQ